MGRKKKHRNSAQKALARSLRMSKRLIRRRGKTPGAMPGTIVHTGVRRVEHVTIDLLHYDADSFNEEHPTTLADCFPIEVSERVTWLNVDGLHDTEQLRRLGELASMHPLVIEDVASTAQRPKVEDYDSQLYIVLRMLRFDDHSGQTEEEQLSLILSRNRLISVQEAPGDVFDSVRERLRSAKGRLRRLGADYLAYSLMDAVVDAYFTVVEKLGDRIDELEEVIIDRPAPHAIAELHRIRSELLVMRRAVWPLRDVFNALIRDDTDLIAAETKVFLRDAYDHTVQVIDTVETLRDVLSGLMDVYLSNVSNRMNEVMKVLTIIATLFIPLTFIVGVYGMNFRFMPELDWPWAYPVLWIIMILIAAFMIYQFRRRGWL
jgi:magnesium transporter